MHAIKILKKQYAYSFDQEVAALKELGHPCIVHLLYYSKNHSYRYFIMVKMVRLITKWVTGLEVVLERW